MVPIGVIHVTSSCWNAVIQCFGWFGKMLLPDTSLLLNVIIIHSVLLSMFRAYCCCCSAPELSVFFGARLNIFYTSRYLVLVLSWVITIGWHSTQSMNTRTLKCRKYIHACCVRLFFCPIFLYFLCMTLSKLPPFRNLYAGSHGTDSSPIPTTVLAFVVLVAKKKRFRIRFPSLASPCVGRLCIDATCKYNTQHAGCETQSEVSSYADSFVSSLDVDPNEHIRHFV